jgi:hypothetical protein
VVVVGWDSGHWANRRHLSHLSHSPRHDSAFCGSLENSYSFFSYCVALTFDCQDYE